MLAWPESYTIFLDREDGSMFALRKEETDDEAGM